MQELDSPGEFYGSVERNAALSGLAVGVVRRRRRRDVPVDGTFRRFRQSPDDVKATLLSETNLIFDKEEKKFFFERKEKMARKSKFLRQLEKKDSDCDETSRTFPSMTSVSVTG